MDMVRLLNLARKDDMKKSTLSFISIIAITVETHI
jgi:hypothetical protein